MRTRLLLIGLLILSATPAFAAPYGYGFQCITANAPVSCGIGEQQISGTVTAGANPGDVLFTFFNAGPVQSSVSEIYFDTTLPFTNATVINEPGVDFCMDGQPCSTGTKTVTYDTTPGNLPGGTTISFSADYSAGATNPEPKNGINPGEQLGIEFTLASGNPGDALSTVILAVANDSLRIGAHLVGLPNSLPSVSLVDSPAPIPEPMTLVLLGTGLCGLGAFRRRRSESIASPQALAIPRVRKEDVRSQPLVVRSVPQGTSVSVPLRI